MKDHPDIAVLRVAHPEACWRAFTCINISNTADMSHIGDLVYLIGHASLPWGLKQDPSVTMGVATVRKTSTGQLALIHTDATSGYTILASLWLAYAPQSIPEQAAGLSCVWVTVR